MGIFRRIADLFRANVNDAIDKAEDPEKMIKQYVIDMQEAITKATSGLAQAMAQEKKLERDYLKFSALSQDWNKKAMMALQAGNEDLARQALVKKSQADSQSSQYKAMWDNARETTSKLKNQVDTLKAKLDEARTKESMLIARSQTAKAQKSISKHLNSYDADSVFAKFDKFEEKILANEAEADAMSQIAASSTSLEDEFKKLSSGAQVDAEFEKLKAQMAGSKQISGNATTTPQLNAPSNAQVDDDLAKLKAQLNNQ
jgi:phage shock protein A